MDPEVEYKAAIQGGLGEAADMIVRLGLVVAGAAGLSLVIWAGLWYGVGPGGIVTAIAGGVRAILIGWPVAIATVAATIASRIIGAVAAWPLAVRSAIVAAVRGVARLRPIRVAIGYFVGTVTLAVGAVAWASASDGGQVGRTRRFWLVDPATVDGAVLAWSTPRANSAAAVRRIVLWKPSSRHEPPPGSFPLPAADARYAARLDRQ